MRVYLYPRKTYAVSVIIPMYNAERYIGECLDSLLVQTFQDFEVIVVDDCSTDNSAKVVESYAPKFNGRLTFLTTEENSGGGGLPRNKGLMFSRGEYVFFIDSDDVIYKSGLEEVYMLAEKHNADVVYCERYSSSTGVGQQFIDNIKHICPFEGKMQMPPFVDKPTFETENMTERIEGILERRVWVAPWNKLVRRNLLIEHKIFFPHTATSEDTIWVYGLIFYAKKFLRVPNIIYIRRFSGGSMTGTRRNTRQKIKFCINPVLLGLKYLDDLMSGNEFFKTNLSCRYDVLKHFVKAMFHWAFENSDLAEEAVYSTIKDEFTDNLGEQDVVISALCAALYAEKIDTDKKYLELVRKFSARIDFKLVSKAGAADFKILSVSDVEVSTYRAGWLPKNELGYFFNSYAGKLTFVVKAVTGGRFVLDLKGIWVPDPKDRNKRVPYWIDYTKLIVKGKVIFDKVTPAWHDKPFNYALEVKAGEEIKIQTEWLPHRAATPAQVVQKQIAPAVDKFLPYLTARLDAKFSTEEGGDFKIVSVSDKQAVVKKPDWFNKGGIGYVIQSHVGEMKLVTKATSNGQLSLKLRGLWVPDPDDNSKLIPYWIDYTRFVVNGKIVFDKATPAWHDEPFIYTLDVKAGEEIKIQTEWLPHRAATPAQVVQKQIAPAVDKFLPYLTARLDAKFSTEEGGDFKIVSVSDKQAVVKKPDWFNKGGIGYVIQSHAGEMKLVAKATSNGQLSLKLRSLWVPDPDDNSKRIPYWIDYTRFVVNGKIVFDKVTPAWHDEPFVYNLDVKADEEIFLDVEWLPHMGEVPKIEPPPPEKVEPPVVDKFLPYLTARLDAKLVTEEGGDFKIVSVSDKQAVVKKPDWFNKGGIGYVIQSHAGEMKLVAKATSNGQLNLKLRGLWVPDSDDKSKLIPYWIDYTKLVINGKFIFNKVTPAWHDEPFIYILDVKAGDEIELQIEWRQHLNSP